MAPEAPVALAGDEDAMPELPSYEDVLKEDAQRMQGSQSAPPPRPPRPSPSSRPQPPPGPQYRPRPQSSAPARPGLPWRYPSGFYCHKCNNTGYKIKNGRSCKSCWRRFAPPNSAAATPSLTYGSNMWMSPFAARPMYMGAPSPAAPVSPGGRPLVVQPGDPRLGGVVCGECRGTGRISFLLDEDICPLCRGIGRIIA
ncbi:hypothetical protein HG536_0A00590 [Torulaspora globosa]|uniref:Uncharacterized protein n=1 Tax=Torulaspora globosa TaxID=48254 RepID=A0A7G3Z9Q6_9SACH|nr:uncharacterized protein HG536_0A00590 [Torulaspora globosa]QLL30242.1 hypothetical protein HG536_0A00590 [Torulaspora globosa]